MDCRNAEHELLQIEALSPDDLWPNELTNHVAVCGACRQKLEDLSNLERAWRAIPLPVGLERAPESFLVQLARQATPRRRRARVFERRVGSPRHRPCSPSG